MVTTGKLGSYRWAEFWKEQPELHVPDVVGRLSGFVLGLVAVNVSWDSGRLSPSDEDFGADWVVHDGYAVTPPIDEILVRAWPSSGEGYDEWYFFRVAPLALALGPFCNWQGTSLKDAGKLAFPGGLYLARQLEETRPELVLGEGLSIYVIARDAAVVDAFVGLATETAP